MQHTTEPIGPASSTTIDAYNEGLAPGDVYEAYANSEHYDPIEARRFREMQAIDRNTSNPDTFHFQRSTFTPSVGHSPTAEYASQIGERETATVMGREVQAFADECGIPPERERHGIDVLEDNEYMSLMPRGAFNEGTSLQGMYTDDSEERPSLLTEPVSMNPARFGPGENRWPEGAVGYVGVNESERNWDRYNVVGGEHVDDEYVRNKEADPEWSPVESSLWTYDPECGIFR